MKKHLGNYALSAYFLVGLAAQQWGHTAMGSDSIGLFGVCCTTAWCIALRLMTSYLRATRRSGIPFTIATSPEIRCSLSAMPEFGKSNL
ncbi:hypothetical protein [Nitrosomonas sp. wSCUT-2]